MIERLFASSAPTEEAVDEEMEEDGDSMKLTSLQSITDFMNCAGTVSYTHLVWIWTFLYDVYACRHEGMER